MGGGVPPTCPPLNALVCHKLGGPNPKPHTMATMLLGPPGALALGGVHAPPTQWAAIKCASGWCGGGKGPCPQSATPSGPHKPLGGVWCPRQHGVAHPVASPPAPPCTHPHPPRPAGAMVPPHTQPMGATGACPPCAPHWPPLPWGVGVGYTMWIVHWFGPWHCVAAPCTTFKFY